MQNTRVSQLRNLLQARVQCRRVEQDGGLPGGLLEGLGQVLYHSPLGILVEERVVLHDQEAVVVLLQDGHELKGCEGPAHLKLREVAVQAAGAAAADEEDLVALQFQVAAAGYGQHPHGGDQDAEGLGELRQNSYIIPSDMYGEGNIGVETKIS
jgi:hypothetical protein